MGIFDFTRKREDKPPRQTFVDPENVVYDPAFFVELRRCRKLRDALLRSETTLTGEARDACQLGDLNLLREVVYGVNGRQPTPEEWHRLEWRSQTLWDALSIVARKKFVLGEISWAFTALCVVSGALALLSLFFGFSSSIDVAPTYIMWLVSLGAMGSVAFIGMNALSIQDDATFDLTNGRLISLRIMLGALFGVVLSVSFSYESFKDLIGYLNGHAPPKAVDSKTSVLEQTMYLLLPFILGFSTSLVITILNRFVDAIQTFFGQSGTRADAGKATIDEHRARAAAPALRRQSAEVAVQPVRSVETATRAGADVRL